MLAKSTESKTGIVSKTKSFFNIISSVFMWIVNLLINGFKMGLNALDKGVDMLSMALIWVIMRFIIVWNLIPHIDFLDYYGELYLIFGSIISFVITLIGDQMESFEEYKKIRKYVAPFRTIVVFIIEMAGLKLAIDMGQSSFIIIALFINLLIPMISLILDSIDSESSESLKPYTRPTLHQQSFNEFNEFIEVNKAKMKAQGKTEAEIEAWVAQNMPPGGWELWDPETAEWIIDEPYSTKQDFIEGNWNIIFNILKLVELSFVATLLKDDKYGWRVNLIYAISKWIAISDIASYVEELNRIQ